MPTDPLAPVDFNISPPVPIVYTDTLMTAKPVKAKDGTVGAARYGVNALLAPDHPQLKQIQDLLMQLAQAAFPTRIDNAGQWSHVGLHFPLSAGDKEWNKGKFVLNVGKPERGRPPASGTPGPLLTPPRLWSIVGGKYVQYDGPTRDAFAPLVWDGVLALMSVQFKAYTGMGGGVTCYLNDLVSMVSGDKIVGIRKDASATFGPPEAFTQYMGTVQAVDPTAATARPW
jgi:hypothetical protein